jgi:tRNA dimethylallyltransferase
MTKTLSHVTVVCGPTASGKSIFAMQMAKQIGGAIINADSCQVYKNTPILTASPTAADKSEIPHYLYNFLDLADDFSVAKYLSTAVPTVEQIAATGHHPIIVGGTGLYINALLHGLSAIPNIDLSVRMSVRQEFENLGKEVFYNKLISLDPLLTHRITSGDSQRMIRAYEVLVQTGQSILKYQASKTGGLQCDATVIILLPQREYLYKTCNERFIKLVENGGLEEVRSTLPLISSNVPKILGFKELASHLQGKVSLADAISLAQTKTRRYAKRQVTWFSHQMQSGNILRFSSADEFAQLLK